MRASHPGRLRSAREDASVGAVVRRGFRVRFPLRPGASASRPARAGSLRRRQCAFACIAVRHRLRATPSGRAHRHRLRALPQAEWSVGSRLLVRPPCRAAPAVRLRGGSPSARFASALRPALDPAAPRRRSGGYAARLQHREPSRRRFTGFGDRVGCAPLRRWRKLSRHLGARTRGEVHRAGDADAARCRKAEGCERSRAPVRRREAEGEGRHAATPGRIRFRRVRRLRPRTDSARPGVGSSVSRDAPSGADRQRHDAWPRPPQGLDSSRS